ncbi:MAG: M16 family metallopeptidase, partial [Bacteroidota bacterium]
FRSLSVGVWVEVGSRDEDERSNGISHFVEHMAFKGTRRYSARKIARSLESLGGYLNAFTSKEHTCFYARVLDEHLEQAIDVLSELILYPRFDPKDVEKEKLVVLEEIRNIEDNPDELIHDEFEEALYPSHPIGFPVIGKADNITRFSSDDLFKYRRSHYNPARLVVAAAGNVVHEKLVDTVRRYFKPDAYDRLARGSTALNRGEASRRRAAKVNGAAKKREVEKPIAQAHVCLGTVAYSIKSKYRYTLFVLNTLLGDGMSSRLYQNIRELHGLAYSVYSFINLMSDTGSFGIYLGTEKQNVENSLQLIHREISRLKAKLVSRAELRRTQAQLKGSMMIGLENMTSRMMRIGTGELYFREYITLDRILKNIDSVTPEMLQEVAQKLFDDDFTMVIYRPA